MTRVLVAGVGNVFRADDGFGVEVVGRLARSTLPSEVVVADFGTRGFDLALALLEPLEAVVLVDAAPIQESPGTVRLLSVEETGAIEQEPLSPHGLSPWAVLQLVRQLGGTPPPLYLVACQPDDLDEGEARVGLSPACQAAVAEAQGLVLRLLRRLLGQRVSLGVTHA